MKYFCLHHPPLIERRLFLEKKFTELSLDVEWITLFDPKESTHTEILQTNLTKQEISLYKKHRWCLEQQITNQYEHILIFEDDVMLPENFVLFLNRCMKEFTELQGDVMFLGICCNIMPKNIVSDKYVYYSQDHGSRCAHCYVVNLRAAERIFDNTENMNEPWDWKLGNCLMQHGLRSCYTWPAIYQATEQRLLPSSLRNLN